MLRAIFGSRFMVMPSMYSVGPMRLAEAFEAHRAALTRKEGNGPRPVGPTRQGTPCRGGSADRVGSIRNEE